MANINLQSILYSKKVSQVEFMFDSLFALPLSNFLYLSDIEKLNNIATSLRYSGNISKKYKAIDEIMKLRGFTKFGAGTNRVVYRPYEYPPMVVKIAIDSVGISDNPAEYENQWLLKPFITKVFETSRCGTIASFERVQPITNKKEFYSVSEDIFYLISNIVGKYVVADIGTKFFMNYGLRMNGFGPVLLDFPYVYILDGKKLICNLERPENNFIPCGGSIDYDSGFNTLRCTKCGKEYLATELKRNKENNLILITDEEDIYMKVRVFKNGKLIEVREDGVSTMKETVKDAPWEKPKKEVNIQEKVEIKSSINITPKEEDTEETNTTSTINSKDPVSSPAGEHRGSIRKKVLEKESNTEESLPVMDAKDSLSVFGLSDKDFEEEEKDYSEYEEMYGEGGVIKYSKKPKADY